MPTSQLRKETTVQAEYKSIVQVSRGLAYQDAIQQETHSVDHG